MTSRCRLIILRANIITNSSHLSLSRWSDNVQLKTQLVSYLDIMIFSCWNNLWFTTALFSYFTFHRVTYIINILCELSLSFNNEMGKVLSQISLMYCQEVMENMEQKRTHIGIVTFILKICMNWNTFYSQLTIGRLTQKVYNARWWIQFGAKVVWKWFEVIYHINIEQFSQTKMSQLLRKCNYFRIVSISLRDMRLQNSRKIWNENKIVVEMNFYLFII